MAKKKEKLEDVQGSPTAAKSFLFMLEAIRLEVRASAEETPAFRAALRSESDAISARVLRNA